MNVEWVSEGSTSSSGGVIYILLIVLDGTQGRVQYAFQG